MPLRLLLEPMSIAALDVAIHDAPQLGSMLMAQVASQWEGFPEALPLLRKAEEDRPASSIFGSYFFFLEDPRTLVGMGGFKAEPSPEGLVEIGYAIAPGFQNRGLATRAVEELKARAFSDARVRTIIAHTLPVRTPSTRVLEKTGFAKRAEGESPEVGRVWRWSLERP